MQKARFIRQSPGMIVNGCNADAPTRSISLSTVSQVVQYRRMLGMSPQSADPECGVDRVSESDETKHEKILVSVSRT